MEHDQRDRILLLAEQSREMNCMDMHFVFDLHRNFGHKLRERIYRLLLSSPTSDNLDISCVSSWDLLPTHQSKLVSHACLAVFNQSMDTPKEWSNGLLLVGVDGPRREALRSDLSSAMSASGMATVKGLTSSLGGLGKVPKCDIL